jgi:drug/metabolite transporter (DMT)-like permease
LEFVYVIVAVPTDTPVTKPVLLTVATAVLDETHGFTAAAVALPVSCVVRPTQTDNVPVMVGNELTVTSAVCWQPFVLVYVIVAVPAETPVTKPVLLTVATAVLDETHGLTAAAVALPVSCVVRPTQTDNVPVIVGNGLTVTSAVCWQPFELVYVIVAVPAETPVTKPVLLTVATAVLDETHGLTAAAVALPVSCAVRPTQTDNVPVIVGNGLTVTSAVC